jgi:hypothetical protein
MRRGFPIRLSSVAMLPVILAGCGSGAASPAKVREATVATAAGGSLQGASLEKWLLLAPRRPDLALGVGLVETWTNSAQVIDAFRHGATLDDSATVDEAIRPDAIQGVAGQFIMGRNATLPPVTDAEADSLAELDRVRVFQQLVLRIPGKRDSAIDAALINRGLVLVRRAQSGTPFTTLVKEASEDSISRAHEGFLPGISREDLSVLPQKVQAIWLLKPGDVSQMIAVAPRIFIFRRATRAESRPYLKAWLAPRFAQRADSLYLDSLTRAAHIVVAADARPRLRALAVAPVVVRDSAPMATWTGGVVTPGMARTALLRIPTEQRIALTGGSDSIVTSFLYNVAQQQVVARATSSAPMPTPEARAVLGPKYRHALGLIRTMLAPLPSSASASTAATIYLDSISRLHPGGGFRYYPMPGNLTEVLRNHGAVTMDSNAIGSVVRMAADEWQVAHANDTTAVGRPAAPLTPGGAAPAPGGAPPKPE